MVDFVNVSTNVYRINIEMGWLLVIGEWRVASYMDDVIRKNSYEWLFEEF